jgi:hypothetical protein
VQHPRRRRTEPSGGLTADLSIPFAELLIEDACGQGACSSEHGGPVTGARALLEHVAQQAPGFRADQVQQLRAALPPG